jgi:hypothetical protein
MKKGLTTQQVIFSGNRIIKTDVLNWKMVTAYGKSTINYWYSTDGGKTWINYDCRTVGY